jgi:hypothetical protein
VTLFEHPIWQHVRPYAHLSDGRENLDFLQLPDQLRELALEVEVNCIACGRSIRPMRAREMSERSRVAGTPTERRLFYASTCPSEVDLGCARTKAAKDHKNLVRAMCVVVGSDACDALCLREPWLELILVGIKTLETRTKCMRRKSGPVVLTSSQSCDEVAWDDPTVGGRLDDAARGRALEGLGMVRGLVEMGGFRLGIPGVDDMAACIPISLPSGRARYVAPVAYPRRLVPRAVQRYSPDGVIVPGSSQGFFRVPAALVELAS